jgi:hypothetical protein
MYVSELSIREFRCIARADIDVLTPDSPGAAQLELPNVNLLTGLNGGGKSTVLKALVAAALGRQIQESGFDTGGWVRRASTRDCRLRVGLRLHATDEGAAETQDPDFARARTLRLTTRVQLGTDRLRSEDGDAAALPDGGPARFLVAYGPSRHATAPGNEARMPWITGAPIERVASLLDERVTLRPLEDWLPGCKSNAPERYAEVLRLLGRTLPPSTRFTGELEDGAYLFEHNDVEVPYGYLSEGLRSHIAWLADLLFHLTRAVPSGMALAAFPGTVLVDEIDQRLHPRWQLDILSWVSAAFPRLQFVVTSHSPLLAGGLRPANIAVLEADRDAQGVGAARPRSIAEDVFGRSADGVLTSSYFDLASTRPDPFRKHLRELVKLTRSGDSDAPLQLMRVLGDPQKMTSTTRPEPDGTKKTKKEKRKKRKKRKQRNKGSKR